MKNCHLPLPEQTYASHAAEMAGTHLDLDADLESAGIEHLVKTGKATT
jgi:hypothetical protein